MENSLWVWANEEVGCRSKKLKKSKEEWQKNFAVMEEDWQFEQSSLIACNQQLSRVLLQWGQVTINLKSKLLSSGIEPWSVMWNCQLNYGFAGNYWAESPGTPLDAFMYLLAHWTIPSQVVTQKCKIVSVQN